MRVFVTGATGFIGSAVVKELLAAGHSVLGLSRSAGKAKALAAAGAEVLHGSIEDADVLKQGAARADGVIHLAFNHDFSKFAESSAADRRAIETIGSELAGSERPFIVTSGVGLLAQGRPATEADMPPPVSDAYPRASEATAAALAARGVHSLVVRLPQVHDTRRQGLVSALIQMYRDKGECAYIGDGRNRWAAAHVLDVAPLYRLALEKPEPNARYHAVAEEGVPMRAIVETLGRRLNLPVKSITPDEAQAFFGWFAMFAGHDLAASSVWTRSRLGWQPAGPGLIADLERLELDAG
jgi:nucleoside-diphosphate-sugar epimerase